MSKRITTKGNTFVTCDGTPFIPHGINMVCKDKGSNYIGDYTPDDFKFLKEKGFNLIRLGLQWDGCEPEPSVYNEEYFSAIDKIIKMAAKEDIPVFLDMHQDLYGIKFEDGAPLWATVDNDAEHVRTDLWSESYLISPAVQHSFDNFWRNAEASDNVGVRTHYVNLWSHIAKRYKDNPYVIGYDLMNEPFPGTPGASVGAIMAEVMAGGDLSAFSDEASIMELVGKIMPITASFESEILQNFYEEIASAIRKIDADTIIMFESNYFANAGIPSVLNPLQYPDGEIIPHQAYVPHGYDILVDTEEYEQGGCERVDFIFGSLFETARRLNIPTFIGEWGCYPNASSAQKEQASHLLKLFNEAGVGQTYFDFSHIKDGHIIEVLKRS
ncbi:MAG: glycoside hydrolase family 5 protein [Lachnospiraceae bacterium]|nr:glycoside hydrolase family 5 protein [Lachnospiraceae bacterium]